MHFQTALRQTCLKRSLDALRLLLDPAVHQPIISIPTPWELRECPRHPEIERIVQEEIGQNRADHATLRGARVRSTLVPSSCSIGAFSHRSMYSSAHLHFTCFRTARSKSSWSMLSNRPLMSNSRTQSYFQHRSRVTPTASSADFPGR